MNRQISTVMAFAIILAMSIMLVVVASKMEKSIPAMANDIVSTKADGLNSQ